MRRILFHIVNFKKYPHAVLYDIPLSAVSSRCSNRIFNIKQALEQYGIVPRVFVINDPEEDVPDLYEFNNDDIPFSVRHYQNQAHVQYMKIINGTRYVYTVKCIVYKYRTKVSVKIEKFNKGIYRICCSMSYANYNLYMRHALIQNIYGTVSNSVCRVAYNISIANMYIPYGIRTILAVSKYWNDITVSDCGKHVIKNTYPETPRSNTNPETLRLDTTKTTKHN